MNTIFMNSENSKTSDPHRLSLNLTDKIAFRRKDKIYCFIKSQYLLSWKNIKKSYKNNEFKISATTWNEEFKLPDGSYSIADIQDYFQYILKKAWRKNS